jgi:uncharacterized protein YbjT (DUF2867 family)
MKVLLFGATGMIGQCVLDACLGEPAVSQVVAVVRRSTGRAHPKLREVAHGDFLDFSSLAAESAGTDACFFCLGTTSVGKSEAEYRHVTVDITLAAARDLLAATAGAPPAFVYVTAVGTDSHGRQMWARAKGDAERALLALPFRAAFMFRIAFVQPTAAIRSRMWALGATYALMRPLYPLLARLAPAYMATGAEVGRAMIAVARDGWPQPILHSPDIRAAARRL